MDDDVDVWTYGTVLKNPGLDYVVMYLGPYYKSPDDSFTALLVADRTDPRVRHVHKPQVIVCGGRPTDERDIRWVVLP
jgi:hypothetical protein